MTSQEERRVYSLSEVGASIRKTITSRYGTPVWIRAEMNRLNQYPQSGHCYPELVEKLDGKVMAQMKGVIWRNDFLRINEQFLKVTQEPLHDGIHILMLATITFDPTFGLSLRILDIDPVFALGEIERERQLTIQRLTDEGVFDQNKSIPLPLLPCRVAVISAETSKGYADFIKVLKENPWGYVIHTKLFTALLQGDGMVPTVMAQLEKISKSRQAFDLVAIIRGGGDEVGLAAYNNYALCKAIATFPLPVWSGIGHSTNETVTELVSNVHGITPTELADKIIECYHNFARPLDEAERVLRTVPAALLTDASKGLHALAALLKARTTVPLLEAQHQVRAMQEKMSISAQQFIANEHRRLDMASQSLTLLDPRRLLQRGYSMTFARGQLVKSIDTISPGQTITARFADGEAEATIISTRKEIDQA